MNKKSISWMFTMFSPILIVILFTVSQGWAQPQTATSSPIITHSFAIEKGRYGSTLKFYIEADDPNGDMLRIATVAYQPGYGRHVPDWVFLKPEYQKHFLGFLQWNTFSPAGGPIPEWTNVVLKVSVLDKAGNESNVVIFPFEFVMEGSHQPQRPAPFDQANLPMLGHVFINVAPNQGKTF
jgi:hypothetical protein